MAERSYVAERFGLTGFLRRLPKRLGKCRKNYGPAFYLIPLGFAIEAATIILMGKLDPPRFFGLSVLAAACLSLGLHVKRGRKNPLWEFHY
jgi:hypothetical protein